MDASTAGGYMARVRTVAVDAKKVRHAYAARNSKRDTIEDARRKVGQKLRDNKAYVEDKVNVDKPDCVYKVQADGRYTMGIKYGNRFLVDVFDGETYIADVGEEKLPELLDMFAADAEGGMFDTQIKAIMQANIAARNKE